MTQAADPRRKVTRRSGLALAVSLTIVLAAVLALSVGKSASAAGGTLVVDTTFILENGIDPGRAYAPTSSIVDHALYDSLVTFRGDSTTPRPWLATSWKVSQHAKAFTFRLRKNVRFSDGTPLTARDVAFSFRRMANLKGSGAFMLDGVTVSAPTRYTVVLHSKVPNPALLRILATPFLSVVNSKVARAHGGTDATNADKTDKASAYLNANSAGSGPYVLKQYTTNQQVVLQRNPNFWGPRPTFDTVVIRNMPAPTQLLNVQRGANEIALDLSSHQASALKGVQVHLKPSANVMYVDLNVDPAVSSVTANRHIQTAVRYAIDYKGIVALGGRGTIQAAGLVPSVLPGALPASSAIKQNLAKAKAEVAASGIKNPTITLTYPSGLTLNGVDFGVVAQKEKASLAAAGITVNLVGLPPNTHWQRYAQGKNQMTQSYWVADFPDENDFIVFMPGGYAGNRIMWKKGAAPSLEALGQKAMQTVDDVQRARLWRQIQVRLNRESTFIPLIQPAQAIVGSKNLTNVVYNFIWGIDVRSVGTR